MGRPQSLPGRARAPDDGPWRSGTS